MVCLSRPDPFNFFKGCLPQILLGPFLNIWSHILITFNYPGISDVFKPSLSLTPFGRICATYFAPGIILSGGKWQSAGKIYAVIIVTTLSARKLTQLQDPQKFREIVCSCYCIKTLLQLKTVLRSHFVRKHVRISNAKTYSE